MSGDFIEEFARISARLRRDLALVSLAQEWERESWLDPEEMEESETLRLLEVYHDRTEGALSQLDYQIRKLLERLTESAKNP